MKEILPKNANDFFGILCQYPNTFTLEASSTNTDKPRIDNILNASLSNYWCSYNEEWEYFEITFHNYFVSISSYILDFTGFPNSTSYDYPIQWVVSGIRGTEFQNISIVANAEINENNPTKSFSIQNPNYYQKYRITHIGKTTKEKNYFCVANFDIFGKISSIQKNHICITFHKTNFHIILLIFTLVLI